MRIARSVTETRKLSSGTVGLVPTMGFLHEGHLALITAARHRSETVVMSLFVNPLQFDRDDDLARYPRDFERDISLAEAAGADIVFAPGAEEMYPGEQLTRVGVAGLGDALEGSKRPGHFEGVTTVVAKLLAGIQPATAYFGRKDAQQLAIVRRMVADLSFPTEIVGEPIVRETDGLALSSRNVFLSEGERTAALALSRGLNVAADLVEAGERDTATIVGSVIAEIEEPALSEESRLSIEYVSLASQDLVRPLESLDRPAFLGLAAWSGNTRLIDNIHLDATTTGFAADRGIRLDGPSVLYKTGES